MTSKFKFMFSSSQCLRLFVVWCELRVASPGLFQHMGSQCPRALPVKQGTDYNMQRACAPNPTEPPSQAVSQTCLHADHLTISLTCIVRPASSIVILRHSSARYASFVGHDTEYRAGCCVVRCGGVPRASCVWLTTSPSIHPSRLCVCVSLSPVAVARRARFFFAQRGTLHNTP